MIESKIELLNILGDKNNRGKLIFLGTKEIGEKLYCMYEINSIVFCIRL